MTDWTEFIRRNVCLFAKLFSFQHRNPLQKRRKQRNRILGEEKNSAARIRLWQLWPATHYHWQMVIEKLHRKLATKYQVLSMRSNQVLLRIPRAVIFLWVQNHSIQSQRKMAVNRDPSVAASMSNSCCQIKQRRGMKTMNHLANGTFTTILPRCSQLRRIVSRPSRVAFVYSLLQTNERLPQTHRMAKFFS